MAQGPLATWDRSFFAVRPPERTSTRFKDLENVSEGVLGALRGAARSFCGRPITPKERFFNP